MNKRVKELQTGDTFWFSGAWRIVTLIDDQYVHYGGSRINRHGKSQIYKSDTLMANSMLLVKIHDGKEAEKVKSNVIKRLERPPATYDNIKPKDSIQYY